MNQPERVHSLDVVRATALLLGVVLHATLSFWPGMREVHWPISDDSTSPIPAGLFFVIHVFRMSVFYVIAGFFAHLLLERLGAWRFVKNRLRRITLPFVAAMFLVMPLVFLPFIWGQKQLGFSGPPLIPPPIPNPHLPPWGHLWFLYLLMVLYVLWMVLRTLIRTVDRRGASSGFVDRVVTGVVSTGVGPLVLAAPTALVLYHTPWWSMWQGIPPPIMGFVPNFPAVLAFGTAFGFGWFLHRQPAMLEVMKRCWLPNLVTGLLLSITALLLIGAVPKLTVYPLPRVERIVFTAAYNLATWCWVFGFIGAALRFLEKPSARWRYLADASFFVYLVHMPVVYGLQAWMMRWPLHWSVKYVFIVTATLLVTLSLYHWGVRSTFVGQFLNGRRYPRGTPLTSGQHISPG